jgi:adenylate cyclase
MTADPRSIEQPVPHAGDSDGLTGTVAAAAANSPSIEAFLAGLGAALSAPPFYVERIFASLQTLHPAFRARTYLWAQDRPEVEVVEWPHGLRNRPGYYASPDFTVHRSGEALRIADLQAATDRRCDLYGVLKQQGYVDYLMIPLPFSDGTVNTLSIATRRAGGFDQDALARIRALHAILVIVFERYAALEAMNAALDTYLGRSVAREVLKGNIRTGYGETVEAAILFTDLRGFTRLSATLPPAAIVRLLNEYFDCIVGPIEENGGYVLKFIGDAVLGFFPVLGATPEAAAPRDAVRSIHQRLGELNDARGREGLAPLGHALCFHFGPVLYGNVGSSERLDFTIIGEPVNVAARGVEAAKTLNADYLFTGAFVERFGGDGLTPLGAVGLRGIAEPVTLFAWSPSPAPAPA